MLAALLLLSACTQVGGLKVDTAAPAEDTGGEGTDTGEPATCSVQSVEVLAPSEGHPVGTQARVVLAYEGQLGASDASIEVTGDEGEVPYALESLADGTATFAPEQELAASSTYQWNAELCGVGASGSFTTGIVGDRVEPSELEGVTFAVDLSEGEVVEPEQFQYLVKYVMGEYLLLQVLDIADDALDIRLALGTEEGNEVVQDECQSTQDLLGLSFLDDPYFSFGPLDLEVEGSYYSFTLHDAAFTAAFDGDSRLVDGTLDTQFDTRDFTNDGSGRCTNGEIGWGNWTIPCSACSDGELQCVDVRVEQLSGGRVSVELEEITDPDCR